MKFRPKYLLPSPYELIGLGVLAVVIVLLSHSQQLLTYYGLNGTARLVSGSVGGAINQGLAKIGSFAITDTIVTFGIWALVGLLCFSIAQGVAVIYQTIEYDEELSSDKYVHPRTFRRASFWGQVLFDSVEAAVCVALVAGSLGVLLALLMPIALVYTQTFLFDVSLPNSGNFLIGFAVLYTGLVLVDVCVRLLVQRHHLFGRQV